METDFLEWYVSGGVTNYVGSKTLPYFGSGGVLTPNKASSYLVYALADGRVRANKGAATVVQVTGVAVAPTWSSSANQTLAEGVSTLNLFASDAVTFSVVSGSMPSGLALSSAGVLTGTITAAGSYSATIRAHGAVIGLNSDRAFTFTVVALPVWSTAAGAQASAPRNVAYSKQFAATNAVSFSLLSGSVPTGTTLSALGLLSGTPTTAGTYSFTIRATGSAAVAYVDRAFSVLVT